MSALDSVNRETMLRSAHGMTKVMLKKGRPLWAFVRDLCCVGRTRAHSICREIGWEPDADAFKPLPPRKP